jgi:LmbE family N-acetylglucosaminyl deacetylase
VSARVLVLSPHPDDDAIGCGGTLCRHVAAGDAIKLIVLTSGEAGGHGHQDAVETMRLREAEARAASMIIGINDIEFWREPDGKLQLTDNLLSRLMDTLETWKPSIIYAPHPRESHLDHQAAAELARRVLNEHAAVSGALEIRLYEVWTPLQTMDTIVDISDYVQQKLASIREHKTQIDIMRLDDAIIGLNRYRGEMHSWPGGDYAEVFQRLRI